MTMTYRAKKVLFAALGLVIVLASCSSAPDDDGAQNDDVPTQEEYEEAFAREK